MSFISTEAQASEMGRPTKLLAFLDESPAEFDEPTYGNEYRLDKGVREVIPGPPSPPRASHRSHSGQVDGEGSHSTAPSSSRHPSSPVVGVSSQTTPSATPTRKGKEPGTYPSSVTTTPKAANAPHRKASADHQPLGIDLSWPHEVAHLRRPAAGLINRSMACYCNSILQVMLHTPPLLRIAFEHGKASLKTPCPKRGFCVLCALHVLANKHFKGNSYRPDEIFRHLGQIRKGFNATRQEDAHELFRFMTDGLQATAIASLQAECQEVPAKTKNNTWVHQLWGGQVRSRVVCARCKKPSDTFDSFLDLSLDLPQYRPTLTHMLEDYVKEEALYGDNRYHCEMCTSKANAIKFFRIAHAPPVLTFHLKRFDVKFSSYGKSRTEKNNSLVDYPEYLDISPYMVDPKEPNTKYRLFAVTSHFGFRTTSGHYTSHVRGPSGRWFHADDEDMSVASENEALRDKDAYLLSYMRVEGSMDKSASEANNVEMPSRIDTHEKKREKRVLDEVAVKDKLAEVNGRAKVIIGPQLPPEIAAKRKRESMISPDVTPRPAKRDHVAESPPDAYRASTCLERDYDSPAEEPQQGASKFTWRPTAKKIHLAAVEPDKFYNHANSSIPRYGTSSFEPGPRRDGKKGKKAKKRGQGGRNGEERRGVPMPFAQGHWGAGHNKEPGLINRMKGKNG